MMRFRKNDPTHNLLAAVERYVKANGGKVIVIGGTEIQKWPDAGEFNFRVAVRCTGRQPVKSTRDELWKR